MVKFVLFRPGAEKINIIKIVIYDATTYVCVIIYAA